MSVLSKTFASLVWLSLLSSAGVGATTKPILTTTLSLRESFDENLFIQDTAPLGVGQTVAALPAEASAFITEVGANFGLAWKQSPALQLNAAYAVNLLRYSQYQTENHTDHRFSVNAAGAGAAWRYEAKAYWLLTDGSHESPIFNRLGGSPPIGSEPVRSRRAQDIYRGNGRLTHDFSHGFVRGMFAGNFQDFHTYERNITGYANYINRSEWSTGVEVGWKLRPELYLVAAVRGGQQHQANLLNVPLNYSNTLTRWLVGIEGKLNQSVKFNVLAGPDVRQFGSQVRPGYDRHQTTPYLEASATWTPNKDDSIMLSARRYLWVSSGGRSIYVDGLYDLSWKHTLTREWAVTTGLNLHSAVTGRFNPVTPRDDMVYAVTGALAYTINPKTKLIIGFSQDWSVSQLPLTPGREYHRRIYDLGFSRQW